MWYERPLHVKSKFRNFNCFCFTTFLIWFNKMPCFLVSVLDGSRCWDKGINNLCSDIVLNKPQTA